MTDQQSIASVREALTQHFCIDVSSIAAVFGGTRADCFRVATTSKNGSFFAKLFNSEISAVAAEKELLLSSALHESGFLLTPAILLTRSGAWLAPCGERNLSLQEWRAAELFPPFLSPLLPSSVMESAAEALFQMHQAASPLAHLLDRFPVVPPVEVACDELLQGCVGSLSPDELALCTSAASAVKKLRLENRRLFPSCLIHGDFHPGNLCFTSGRASGLFDFEFAHVDRRLWDLAYAAIFFCADWSAPKELRLDAERAQKFLEAYDRAAARSKAVPGPLTQEERSAFRAFMSSAAALNFLWATSELSRAEFSRAGELSANRGSVFEQLKAGSFSLLRGLQ